MLAPSASIALGKQTSEINLELQPRVEYSVEVEKMNYVIDVVDIRLKESEE